jgi:hypothetical protein
MLKEGFSIDTFLTHISFRRTVPLILEFTNLPANLHEVTISLQTYSNALTCFG